MQLRKGTRELHNLTRQIMQGTGFLRSDAFPKFYPISFFERCGFPEVGTGDDSIVDENAAFAEGFRLAER